MTVVRFLIARWRCSGPRATKQLRSMTSSKRPASIAAVSTARSATRSGCSLRYSTAIGTPSQRTCSRSCRIRIRGAPVYRVLRRAQTEGSLRSDLDARALARFFLGVAQGINVVNKAVADPEVLKDMARVAMSVWGRNSAATVQSRPARAFIRVNCAAISPSLIASELFGHEQGAFTGALQRRIGRGRITFSTRQGKPGVDTVLQALRFTKQGFERPASPRRPDGYPDSQAPDAGRSGAPELLYSHVQLGRPLADKFPLNRFEPSVRAGENLGPDEEVMSGPESNRRRNQGLGEYG